MQPKLPVKRLREIVAKMPFNQLIGISLTRVHPGWQSRSSNATKAGDRERCRMP
jgi:hypothetical protein